MAVGSRGKARGRGRGRGRTRKKDDSDMPDVYQDMLADAGSSPTRMSEEGRTLKKRRVGGRLVVSGDSKALDEPSISAAPTNDDQGMETDVTKASTVQPTKQTVYDDSEDSEESDMDWQDVRLEAGNEALDSGDEPGDLSLVIGGEKDERTKNESSNRKQITAAERKLRLEIHKMHLLSLSSHVYLRNHWCNDSTVQESLLRLLNKRTRSYLDDDESQSQFQRSRSLTDGLEQASEAFRTNFQVNARGMSKCHWAEDAEELANFELPDDIDLPMQKHDFCAAASKLEGSRDIGIQLFCSMLRATGLDVRLVCSLQPLPFTATTRGSTPMKSRPTFTVTYPETRIGLGEEDSGQEGHSDVSTDGSLKLNSTRARIMSRLGRPAANIAPPAPVIAPKAAKRKKKPIRESPYPVFWVEVFSIALQKWLPVDPLVTKKIAKPFKLEPPASDSENNLSYVLAFEDDGSARDVTKRYARAYNAKTRRQRVESTKEGDKWWKRVMRIYKRSYALDRDRVEDAELAAKEAAEGMPKNIVEFKNHPYYALERHLRRNEVVHPKREVGKVSAARLADGDRAVEPVYRRRDVHVVKSEDGWYRLGRELKDGEEPLKLITPRRKKDPLFDEDASEGEGEAPGTAMYAAFQTNTYKAPPVVNGRIPRNVYGNLDVYVASMIPAGGVHISHPDTARAARILGIDYADAVTGFEFRGRNGTAIIKGAVVAGEYHDAVVETIHAFEYAREEEEISRRSQQILRLWKRFLLGLRIKERIDSYAVEGEEGEQGEGSDEDYKDEDEEEDEEEGGFFGERVPTRKQPEDMEPPIQHVPHQPIVSTWGAPLEIPPSRSQRSPRPYTPSHNKPRGFSAPDNHPTRPEDGGGFNPEASASLPISKSQSQSPTAAPLTPNLSSTNDDSRDGGGGGGGFVILTSAEVGTTPHDNHPGPTAKPSSPLSTDDPPKSPSSTLPQSSSVRNKSAVDAVVGNEDDGAVAGGISDRDRDRARPTGDKQSNNSHENSENSGGSSGSGRESDNTSLLSHDPEDEDADPEWLV